MLIAKLVPEIATKSKFELAKRYIVKLHSTFLSAKLLRKVEKLEEKGREKLPSEAMQFRDHLIEFLKKNFKYERSIELASTDRLFIQQISLQCRVSLTSTHPIIASLTPNASMQPMHQSVPLSSSLSYLLLLPSVTEKSKS